MKLRMSFGSWSCPGMNIKVSLFSAEASRMGLSGILDICLWGVDCTYSHNLPGAEIQSRAPAAQCHLLCSES